MYDNSKSGIIRFAYGYNSMFNSVSQLSAYMVKNISAETGEMLDNFAITEDERDLYDKCINKVVLDIYDVLSKISSKNDGAFRAYSTILDLEATEPFTEFCIINNCAYNINSIQLVDSTIEECLRYGILSEFYIANTHPALQRNAQDMYDRNMQLLDKRLFQLRKKRMSSLL